MQLLKGAHVVDPQVDLDTVVDILIDDSGKIAKVESHITASSEHEVIDCSGKYIIPGMVDLHVHFRDPGFEYKETIESGLRAAAKGGFTDVATMPNTSPVTDTGTAVRYQIDRSNEAMLGRVHPVGALTQGEKGEALAEIGDMTQAGACGFSDDGHGVQSAGMMRTCMEYVTMFDRVVMVHCQDESLTKNGVINEGRASTRLGMFGWPALGEEIQISRDIDLCRLTSCPLHIQHISTARGLELVKQAKKEGLPVTCEVTPHHLFLTDEDITDTYNTNLKVNPPLRTPKDALALREGLLDGSIDCIATDHAPHAAHEKDCEFEIAYFGTVGLETALPLVWTHLVQSSELSISRLVEALCVKPRQILHLNEMKIQAGYSADLTVIDPHAQAVVTPEFFEGKSYNSAFLGQSVAGLPCDVFVEGRRILTSGVVTPKARK